jgi:Flagellin hook IN motif
MSINPVTYGQFARVRAPAADNTPQSPAPVAATNSQSDLLRARDELLQVYESLLALADLADVRTRLSIDLPDAVSNPGLNLDLSSTAARLFSSEEINASPTSFSPFGPDWALGSSTLLTIGGEYDGSHGTGALSFEARNSGIKGLSNLRIRVRDPDNNIISNTQISASDPPDQQYQLGNGLFFTISAGTMIQTDTTSIQVDASTGSVFNPALPFNGTRNDNPNFQYYPAPGTLNPVVDGSFELNGTSIGVNAGDTLNDVVNRINAAATGVNANYNSTTEQLEFLQSSNGSQATIDLQNDTSNLLAALKLSNANLIAGTDPESEIALQDVAPFSAVQSGDILINGTTINVDSTTDSLVDVIDRINGSAAGVNASFDTQTQRVTIEGTAGATSMEIDGNGTGLFAALNIPEGTLDVEAGVSGISKRRAYRIADSFEEVFGGLNRLFRDSTFLDGADHTGLFRGALSSAVSNFFGGSELTDERFGIQFDNSAIAKKNGGFALFERRDFARDLQLRSNNVKRLLAGGRGEAGLIDSLGNATIKALNNINSALGLSGTFIDTFA